MCTKAARSWPEKQIYPPTHHTTSCIEGRKTIWFAASVKQEKTSASPHPPQGGQSHRVFWYETFFATHLMRAVPKVMLDFQMNCSYKDPSPDEQFLSSGKLGLFPVDLASKRLWFILGRGLCTWRPWTEATWSMKWLCQPLSSSQNI